MKIFYAYWIAYDEWICAFEEKKIAFALANFYWYRFDRSADINSLVFHCTPQFNTIWIYRRYTNTQNNDINDAIVHVLMNPTGFWQNTQLFDRQTLHNHFINWWVQYLILFPFSLSLSLVTFIFFFFFGFVLIVLQLHTNILAFKTQISI